MRRIVFCLLVVGLLTPAVASACSCGTTGAPPRPPRERVALFVGIALDSPLLREGPLPRQSTFVTESSWKRAMPDTVLVTYDDAPCAAVSAGSRYLVYADPHPDRPGVLRLGPCDEPFSVDHPWVVSLLDSLGAPRWRARPVGKRALDNVAIAIEARVDVTADPERVRFGASSADTTATLEIAGQRRRFTNAYRPSWYLAPGIYQFRLRWDDGASYAGYLRIACERRAPESGQCEVFRSLSRLRPRGP
jgi:hypothetical protein